MADGLGRFDGATHSFAVRVYWEDTDAGGLVYYANYLRYTERARTELLRDVGLSQAEMLERHAAMFVVRECNVQYLKPARLEDDLEVRTRLTGLGAATLSARQNVLRDTVPLIRTSIRLACVNPAGRACRVPMVVRRAVGDLIDNTEVGEDGW